jgi:hypothetical protein
MGSHFEIDSQEFDVDDSNSPTNTNTEDYIIEEFNSAIQTGAEATIIEETDSDIDIFDDADTDADAEAQNLQITRNKLKRKFSTQEREDSEEEVTNIRKIIKIKKLKIDLNNKDFSMDKIKREIETLDGHRELAIHDFLSEYENDTLVRQYICKILTVNM